MLLDPGTLGLHSAIAAIIWKPKIDAIAEPFLSAITAMIAIILVRSLSAKYRPDRYRRDKSVKFGTELP